MEYRKREARARRSAGTRHRTGVSRKRRAAVENERGSAVATRLIITLVLIAAAVYIISASVIGTWLAKNVVAPVFSVFVKQTQEPIKSETPKATDVSQITGNVELGALKCYVVQFGVFASRENAEVTAQSVEGICGAGYVYEDAEKYRVIGAVFPDEAEAKELKEELESMGIDCTVRNMGTQSMTFAVTVSTTLLKSTEALTESFEVLNTAIADVIALSIDLPPADAKAEVESITTRLKDGLELVADAQNDALLPLLECYNEFISNLETLAETNVENSVDFSDKMKYNQIELLCVYIDMARAMAEG